MYKKHLLVCFSALCMAVASYGQADTLALWHFNDTTNASFNANEGLSGNLGYNIRAEDTAAVVRPLSYMAAGAGYAAGVDGWDNGMDNKFWSIRFKADGYSQMKIFSKQSSDTIGPKSFKIQCRKSGDSWADVTGGTVTLAADWTTGVVNGIDLPASFDNPGTTSLFVRWIMTSNESVSSGTVTTTGISMIDDILITGINSVGMETLIFEKNVSMYPVPALDRLFIETFNPMKDVQIVNMEGRLVRTISGQWK
jgi:large repetitive protein